MYWLLINSLVKNEKKVKKIDKIGEAISIISNYDGNNPYILDLKLKLINNKRYTPSELEIEYLLINKDVEPKVINKTVRITDWWGRKKMGTWIWDYDNPPDKIKIISYLGETKDYYLCLIKYRATVPASINYIPKQALWSNFLVEDYHSMQIDFDRYDKLSASKNAGRKIKDHQKEAVQFLLSRKKCILADDMGLGKMEPVSSLIPTVDGFKKMGDIEVGDRVFNMHGNAVAVVNVYKHHQKDIYKVTFSDGTSVRCGLEHLWYVKSQESQEWETKSLETILDEGLYTSDENRPLKWLIPTVKPIDYRLDNFNLSYFNDCICELITNIDNEYIEIPNKLKISTIKTRKTLLGELMDERGVITDKNEVFFTVKSKKLLEDVKELIFSLGGIALDINDDTIQVITNFNPFKKKKFNVPEKVNLDRYISKVEFDGVEDAQCIYVDSPEHTYTTGRHYVVTHNTLELSVASIEGNFDSVLIICPASLKTNWKKELMWYVPERDITIIDSFLGKTREELEEFLGYAKGKSNMKLADLQKEAREQGKWKENRFVIVNYDILNEFYEIPKSRSAENMAKALENSPILKYIMNKKSLIIIDEAHRLSDTKSQRYKIVDNLIRRGNPDSVYLATGTPITNNPQNLFCILKLINDPITSDWEYFVKRYCGAMKIPAKGEKERWSNYFLRSRGKTYAQLTESERILLKEYISQNARKITIMKEATNLDELKSRVSHIYLRRVKEDLSEGLPQKTIHEVVYEFNPQQRAEYSRLWADYEKEQLEIDPTKEINKELLEGAVYRRYCSTQMVPNTIKMTEKFISRGEKVIIATCYDDELNQLKEHFGEKCVVYNGKMNQKQKDIAQKAFMEDPNVMVFIGQVVAAGVGLTLTVSNKLIFNSYSYTDVENKQMEDRIYRIGQTKDVDIYYQLFKDTVCERVWNICLRKEYVFNAVIKKEEEK